jgi:hypothetical protein
MKKWYKVAISKPCFENWDEMTTNSTGKFCEICSISVIDFTQKSDDDIQTFLVENKGEHICGRFQKNQLDTINIEIPKTVFLNQYSFSKTFALALLLAMGTSLLNCKTDGKIKKIETITVIDTLQPKKIIKVDNNKKSQAKKLKSKNSKCLPKITKSDTEYISITTTGVIVSQEIDPINDINSYPFVEEDEDIDDIIKGDLKIPDDIIGFIVTDQYPQFINSKSKTKEGFQQQLSEFILDNFDTDLTNNLNLKTGKYKIHIQFTIDKKGHITNSKIRTPHPKLKEEVSRLLKKLPQFIPGKQRNKPVDVRYNLPINFIIED